MKLAALLSGGKDSLLAIDQVKDEHEVKYLISIDSVENSMLLHTENIELVKLQAEAMNTPLIFRRCSESEELETLEGTIGEVKDEVGGVVSGAIASEYQRDRIKSICDKFGLESLTPLWNMDEEKLMNTVLQRDFEVMITKVAAEGLGREWLGRTIDKKTVRELKELERKYRIHLAGEGGEFETLVLDSPFFEKKVDVVESEENWDSKTKSGLLRIKAKLVDKSD
ncbi:MAG: diphthine--ammonia ligase [Candidatus Aenigmatarchaeota archaeon]